MHPLIETLPAPQRLAMAYAPRTLRDATLGLFALDTHLAAIADRRGVTPLMRASQLGFFEGVQVASYSGGGHYGWHMDVGQGVVSTRKLSISVQLSDPADYDGGELEFLASGDCGPRTQGTLIAFPSFLVHRVRPVTRGTRWSLVSWVAGPSFR